jgi:preprotein translocase SecE subunit
VDLPKEVIYNCRIMKKFVEDVFGELKQTTWTKPRQLGSLLVYTIAICGIIALLAFGLDFIFTELRKIIL